MKMELDVELRDVPGQLSHVLDRVTEYGGNIESVVHRRQDARGDWIPVRLVFEIVPARAHRLIEALKDKVRVLSAEGEAKGHALAVMLVGHVFDNRIDAFLDALDKSGCRVHRVQADVTSREQPSAVFIDMTAETEAASAAAIERLESLAEGTDVRIFRSLPEVAA